MVTSKNDQVIIERDFISARGISAPKISVLRRNGMTQQFRSWPRSSEWSSSMRRAPIESGDRLGQLLVTRKGLHEPSEHPDADFLSEGAR